LNDILNFMYQDGQISAKELVALRKTCRELHESPVRVLRSLNISAPEEIQASLQIAMRVPAITDRLVASLDESFKALIPVDIAIHCSVFAIAEEGDSLHVAMEDPSDKGMIHRLEFFLNRRIVPAAATVHQIAEALSRLYELSPEQLKLTTTIESSRGIVAGLKAPAPAATLTKPQSASFSLHQNPAEFDVENSLQSLTARALAADSDAGNDLTDLSADFSLSNNSDDDLGSLSDPFNTAPFNTDAFNSDSELTPKEASPNNPSSPPGLSFEELSDAGMGLEPSANEFANLEPGGIVDLGGLGDLESSQEMPPPQPAAAKAAAQLDDVFSTLDTAKANMNPGDVILFDDLPSSPPATAAVEPPPAEGGMDLLEGLDVAGGTDLLADFEQEETPLMNQSLQGELAQKSTEGPQLFDGLEDGLMAASLLDSENSIDMTVTETTSKSVPGLAEALGEIPDTELNTGLNTELNAEFTTEDPDTNLDVLSESSEVVMEAIPSDAATAITAAINASLIKLSMAKNRSQAIEILNQKLTPLEVSLASEAPDIVTITYREKQLPLSLNEDSSARNQNPLAEIFLPVLKRLGKLKP
jgi:hypothetical protein